MTAFIENQKVLGHPVKYIRCDVSRREQRTIEEIMPHARHSNGENCTRHTTTKWSHGMMHNSPTTESQCTLVSHRTRQRDAWPTVGSVSRYGEYVGEYHCDYKIGNVSL
jgi:hypothetical protein